MQADLDLMVIWVEGRKEGRERTGRQVMNIGYQLGRDGYTYVWSDIASAHDVVAYVVKLAVCKSFWH